MKRQLITVLLISSLFGQEWVQWPVTEYTDLAFHPDSSNIIYLATGSNFGAQRPGGLMVSYDNGLTFDTLFSNISVIEIELHPFNPDTLFLALAGTNYTRPGVMKVTRTGFEYDSSWIDSGIILLPDPSVVAIEIDPISPDTMFAGTAAFGGGQTWRSIDGGQSWSDANPGSSQDVFTIKQHSVNRNEVFYTTGYTRLHRSFDWGETWSESVEWDDSGYPASSMTLFPEEPGKILITVNTVGSYLSEDYGDSWQSWGTFSPSVRAKEIVLAPHNSSHIYLATNDSIFFSDDFGISWSDYTFNFDNVSNGLERLELDPANNRLFAGHHRYGLFSLDLNTVGLAEEASILNEFELFSNYPNPFNPRTTIEYDLPEYSDVSLIIYDVAGREVNTLVSTIEAAGSYQAVWNGTDGQGRQVAGGMYFARLQAGDYSDVVKMVYLR